MRWTRGTRILIAILFLNATAIGRAAAAPTTGGRRRGYSTVGGEAKRNHLARKKLKKFEEFVDETQAAREERNRRACRLFIWNARSALRYWRCTRVLQCNQHEFLYWGKFGRFLRFPAGSSIIPLWPCTDHQPDSCAICGKKFREHLGESALDKTTSRPFENFLDEQRSGKSTLLIKPDQFHRESNSRLKLMARGRKRIEDDDSLPSAKSSKGASASLFSSLSLPQLVRRQGMILVEMCGPYSQHPPADFSV